MSEKISVNSSAYKKIRLLHRGRNVTKANVYICLYQDKRAILKDYKDRNLLVKWIIGRWLSTREFRIYRKLIGIQGVIRVIAKPNHYSFILEYLEGKPLSEMPQEQIHSSTFDSLKRIIKEIHERGIACGDIHHRDVLITTSGETYLIDFATGWQKGSKLNVFQNFIFRKLLALDWLAFYRLRERYTGMIPSPEEKKEFAGVLLFYSLGRCLKKMHYFLQGKT